MDSPADLVASAVRARRTELALSQAAAARKAGISNERWSKIETAAPDSFSPKTLNLVGQALGWEPGWRDRIVDGLRPIPANVEPETWQPSDTAQVLAAVMALTAEVREMRALLTALAQQR